MEMVDGRIQRCLLGKAAELKFMGCWHLSKSRRRFQKTGVKAPYIANYKTRTGMIDRV